MSGWLEVAILSVIQGITEFLPVSSSGHLVLAKHLLKLDSPGTMLEVALHAGTLFSILVYYRKRIAELSRQMLLGKAEGRQYAMAVVIGTIPAVLAYSLAGKRVEEVFNNPKGVCMMLCITGVILLSMAKPIGAASPLTFLRALWIGVAQALALLPGISRSGSTIAAGRHVGLSSDKTAEFSLFLAVPAVLGAVVSLLFKHGEMGQSTVPVSMLVAGAAISAIVGYVSIVCLIKILSQGKLWMFGIYCLAVGATGVLML